MGEILIACICVDFPESFSKEPEFPLQLTRWCVCQCLSLGIRRRGPQVSAEVADLSLLLVRCQLFIVVHGKQYALMIFIITDSKQYICVAHKSTTVS